MYLNINNHDLTIINDNTYTFLTDDIKNTINITDNLIYERESKEYYLYLNFNTKECLYTLKEPNLKLSLKVTNASYQIDNHNLIFTYQLESQDTPITINIERN